MAAQRAAIIQVMLGLLDQDQETVQGTIPILQALAQLPLENRTTRRECLLQLQRLEPLNASPSNCQQPYDPHFDAASDVPTSESDDHERSGSKYAVEDAMPPSFVYEYDDPPLSAPLHSTSSVTQSSCASPVNGKRSTPRDSGRVKSLSLHHCKEFLLACANEIHELDTENPNFDYAEDTPSEPQTTHRGLRQLLDRRTQAPRPARADVVWRTAVEFDYASTVSSSSVSVDTEVDNDDVEADQGSEFSEVLRRADYLSDVDGDDLSSLASWSMPVADEKLNANSVRGFGSVRGLQLQFKRHAFDALKRNRVQQLSKRRAFQCIKSHAQQMGLKRLAMTKLRLATRLRHRLVTPIAKNSSASSASALCTKFVLSQHLDLVFVVLCAIAMQALALRS